MTTVTPTQKSPLHTAAVVLASLVIPLSALAGKVIEAIVDSINPADVDVSQDLAYLRELLGFSFGFFGLLLVVVALLIVQLHRRERSFSAIALPVTVLVAQVIVAVLVLVMTGVVDGIESASLSRI